MLGGAIAESPPEVIIREVRMDELLTVMHINRVCLPENYSYSFFLSIYESYPKSFLVAETDGEIAGYIMCRVERTFSKLERFRLKKAGHVISIAVLPQYRGIGIGKALMLHALEALKSSYYCDEVFLEVRVSNEQAIKLYEQLGFVTVDRLKRYYADGEDAYLMARKL